MEPWLVGMNTLTRTKKNLSFPNRALIVQPHIHVNRIIFSLFIAQQLSDILMRGTLEKYDSHFMNFVLGAFLDRNTDRLDLNAVYILLLYWISDIDIVNIGQVEMVVEIRVP
jgi:hypothetical protein